MNFSASWDLEFTSVINFLPILFDYSETRAALWTSAFYMIQMILETNYSTSYMKEIPQNTEMQIRLPQLQLEN